MRWLAGDVGGTKTYLALYEPQERGAPQMLAEHRYPSDAYENLTPMVEAFLADAAQRSGNPRDRTVTRAAFGVAGPIERDGSGHEQCRATNLPWRIDGQDLAASLGAERVHLLNDFHAVALGIPALGDQDLHVLQRGETAKDGPIAIVGAGTGLGEAIVVPTAGPRRVLASEGGHTDFAPRDEEEIELLRFMLKRHKRVSYERLVSGPGLVALYDFVVETGREPCREQTRRRMLSEDPGKVIGDLALDDVDPACSRAVSMFLSLYGAEAGNLALKVLPTGGLFVAGGIAPRLLPLLPAAGFLASFLDKGRMRHLLEGMQVAIVMNPRVGLLGALQVLRDD